MTITIQTAVIVLLVSGITISLCGSIATLFWRKREISKLDLFWAGSRAAAHPEDYVRAERVQPVKILHLIGVFLFLTGVLILLTCGLRKPA